MRLSRSWLMMLAVPVAMLSPQISAAEEVDPEDAKPCNEAQVMLLMGTNSKAVDLLLACAQVPGQTPYKIAQSRFSRYKLLAEMDKQDQAEAELVALTSPPLSGFDLFTGTPSGNILFGGKQSIGATQVGLLGARANHRVVAKDLVTARALADKAITMAGHDPAFVFDVSSAYGVKAKAFYLEKNSEPMVKETVRAYLRGSQDPWVLDIMKNLPAETQAALETQRKLLQEGAGPYIFAISPQAQVMDKDGNVASTIKAGKAAVKALDDFEASLLGSQ